MKFKKIFLDTNIWLRLFLRSDPKQYSEALKLITIIEEGSFGVYTSTIVMLEVHHVALKIYKIPGEDILKWFDAIRKIRNITLIEKTNFDLALSFYQKNNIKLADCVIASQLPENSVLISFDNELSKIKEITVKKPLDFLQ